MLDCYARGVLSPFSAALSRSAGGPVRLLSAVVALLPLASPLWAQQTAGQTSPETTADGTYMGRAIAPVMSYHGAPWLERPTREQEEAPEELVAFLGLDGGETVVDLGCGSGYYSRRLARAVGETGTVYGVDIQPEMLDILRRTSERDGLHNIVPVLGTPDDLRLPAAAVGKIDLILLVDVYHEIQDPAAMLASMRRALAPEGRVALVEFRLEGDSAAHIKLEHRMSVEQVLAEWQPAGFALAKRVEELPTQHLFLFRRDES